MELTFKKELHKDFIKRSNEDKEALEYIFSEYLRVSGYYWGLTALYLMKRIDGFQCEEIVDNVIAAKHEAGGFGGSAGHDPHILYTLSSLQVLCLFDELDRIDLDQTAQWVAKLQNSDGSFKGDEWGEVDSRFSYCCLASLAICNHLDYIDVVSAGHFLKSCINQDGGFSSVPGAESHGGQAFCVIGGLSILGQLPKEKDDMCLWLSNRQTNDGGFNGRPFKDQDVCYSWWILSALTILGRSEWISKAKLEAFILSCQDIENGGIADRPEDQADMFHTFFGVAALSMIDFEKFDLKPVCPTYAMPLDIVEKLQLPYETH